MDHPPIDIKHDLRHRSHVRAVEASTLEVLFLFVLPITLLYFHIIPYAGRLFVLFIFSLLIYGVIKKEGWTERDLGLSWKTIKPALPVYTIATVLGLFAVISAAHAFHFSGSLQSASLPHFLFVVAFVSFFQEFAFRGFLMPVLSRVFPDTFTVIVVDALLFAGMHAIYAVPTLGLPIAFVAGIFFASLYRKYPNLYLVSISHAILNFAVVWYGLFTLTH